MPNITYAKRASKNRTLPAVLLVSTAALCASLVGCATDQSDALKEGLAACGNWYSAKDQTVENVPEPLARAIGWAVKAVNAEPDSYEFGGILDGLTKFESLHEAGDYVGSLQYLNQVDAFCSMIDS